MCCDKKSAIMWFSGFIGAFAFLMLIQLFSETDTFNAVTFLVFTVISTVLFLNHKICKPKVTKKKKKK